MEPRVRAMISDGLQVLNEPVITPSVIQKQAEKTVKEAMKYLWSSQKVVGFYTIFMHIFPLHFSFLSTKKTFLLVFPFPFFSPQVIQKNIKYFSLISLQMCSRTFE